jgi:hypothetical protein
MASGSSRARRTRRPRQGRPSGGATSGMTGCSGWRGSCVAVGLVLLAPPALATGSIHCRALDGSAAEVTLTLGPLPVGPVLLVRLEAGGRRWSSVPGEAAEPLTIAQAFTTAEGVAVDLVDDQASRQVVSLRILRVEEGRRVHQYGYLHLHGQAVHPIACEGP